MNGNLKNYPNGGMPEREGLVDRWNVTRAADAFGVSRYAFIRLMKKHGVDDPG